MKKWIIASGIAAVFIAVGSIAAISLQRDTLIEVDLTEHIIMEYSGENGNGVAKIKSNDLGLDLSNENYQKFSESMSYTIDPDTNLWNGNEIHITVSYNEGYCRAAGLKPINAETVFMVEGLQTPKLSSDNIPPAMQDEEGQEVFKAYMDAVENTPEDAPEADLSGLWISGQDSEAPKKESKSFLFEDYTEYSNDAFDQAKEYGRTSSQNYRVQPVMNGDLQVGWKTVFRMNKAECLTARFDALSDVFYDPDRLIRHLSVMKYNTQLEWFNLALIAENEFASENGFRLVLSEDQWKANGISFPLKGEGIPLLFPMLQGNKLSWTIRNLYTVGDFGFEEPANENSIPSILNTHESIGAIQELCKIKGDGWQKACFLSYLKSIGLNGENWHNYLLAALELTWGNNLRLRSGVRKKDLCLKVEKEDPLEMYQQLASVVIGFPRYFPSMDWEPEDGSSPYIGFGQFDFAENTWSETMIYSSESQELIRQMAFHRMSKEELMRQLNGISYSNPYDLARIWLSDLEQEIGQMSDREFAAFLEECLSV